MNIYGRNRIVIDCVIPFVDIQDIANVSSVCRAWYEFVNRDNRTWKRLIQDEEMNPEKWDLEDDQEWILGTPCRLKIIFLKYKRTLHNMRASKYKKQIVKVICSKAHYDGKTLLLCTENGLDIYRVINNNFELFQKLSCTIPSYLIVQLMNGEVDNISDMKTNTQYIILKTDKSYLLIYRLFNNEYIPFYCLYSSHDNNVSYCNHTEQILTQHKDSYNYFKLLFKNILLILAKDELILWNICEKKLMFKARNHSYLKHDCKILLILDLKANMIKAFDKELKQLYEIKVEYPVFRVFINYNLLHVWSLKSDETSWITSWDKTSGLLKFNHRKLRFCVKHSKVIQCCYFRNNCIVIAYSVNRRKQLFVGFKLLENHIREEWNCIFSNINVIYRRIVNRFQKIFIFTVEEDDKGRSTLCNGRELFHNVCLEERIAIGTYTAPPYVSKDIIINFIDGSAYVYLYR